MQPQGALKKIGNINQNAEPASAFAMDGAVPQGGLKKIGNINQKPQYQPGIGDYARQLGQGATFNLADEAEAGVRSVFGQPYGETLEGIRASNKKFEQELPLQSLGLQLGGGLLTGGAGATTKAGMALARSLRTGNTLARVAKGAGTGAASGGMYGFGAGEGDDRLDSAGQGALIGGLAGGAIPAAGSAVSSLKNTALPKVEQSIAPLAKTALEKYNIPLTRAQLGTSKIAKTVESAIEKVPFSGAEGFRIKQQKAFNKAISKTIGEDADQLTSEIINKAYEKTGKLFDDALKGRTVKISDDVLNQIGALEDDAINSLTGETAKIVRNNITKVMKDIAADGTMPGEKINSLRSEITRILRRTKNDASPYLSDLRDIIVDASVDGAPGAREMLNKGRLQYKNLKTIEPLAAENPRGDISPAKLTGKVRQSYSDFARGGGGDLGELARIGQAFLKDTIPDSGTAQRAMAYTGLMGMPASVLSGGNLSATLGAPLMGVGLARGFNALNTAQPLVRGAVTHAMPELAPYTRDIQRGMTGNMNGIPRITITPKKP